MFRLLFLEAVSEQQPVRSNVPALFLFRSRTLCFDSLTRHEQRELARASADDSPEQSMKNRVLAA
jgi:hypothetical protein